MKEKGGAPTRRSLDTSISQLFQNAGFEDAEVENLVKAFSSICKSLNIGEDSCALQNLVAMKVVDLAVRGERDPTRISITIQADLREKIATPQREVND